MKKYHVEGMSCGGCSSAVEKAVSNVTPNAEVTVNLESASLTIEGAHDPQAVKSAVEDAGFEFSDWIE